MHLATLAEQQANKAAYIMAATDQVFTFKDLERGSNQLAHLFRAAGLKRGDHIAILLENHSLFLQICVAAQRSGHWMLVGQQARLRRLTAVYRYTHD